VNAPRHSAEFELSAVKRAFSDLVEGSNPFTINRARAAELLTGWQEYAEREKATGKRNFYGASPDEMLEWCKSGFPLAIPAIKAAMTAKANKRKFIRAEEGELILEAAFNGEDFPFLTQTALPARPGLRIIAEYSTLASTPPEALQDYGRFLGELCSLYQSKGYDLALSISQPGRERFPSLGGTSETLIRLKREQVIADPTEWSAVFSPGGYRMLGFVSHLMFADQLGTKIAHGFGSTNASGHFGATFERETRTLKITAPNSYSTFPAATLRDQIERLGI